MCDWLNKFYGFSLLYITHAINKIDERGLINTAHHEHLLKKTKVTWYVLATEGLPEQRSTSIIKVSGQIHSDAFKRRLAFSFTVIILTENNFLLLLNSFATKQSIKLF